jgi:hypothetical protein
MRTGPSLRFFGAGIPKPLVGLVSEVESEAAFGAGRLVVMLLGGGEFDSPSPSLSDPYEVRPPSIVTSFVRVFGETKFEKTSF